MFHSRFVVPAVLCVFLAGCQDAYTAPYSAPELSTSPKSETVCSDLKTTEVLYNDEWVPAFRFDFDAFSYPGAYPDAIVGSQWIGPTPTASADAPAGTYHFRTTFTLPQKESKIIGPSLAGAVHADNSAIIVLNGNTIFQHEEVGIVENFQDPAQTFAAASGFVGGINTVAFDLWNDPYDGPNPAALDFCFTVTYTKHDTGDEGD